MSYVQGHLEHCLIAAADIVSYAECIDLSRKDSPR